MNIISPTQLKLVSGASSGPGLSVPPGVASNDAIFSIKEGRVLADTVTTGELWPI
jgi:hypothetical protein